MNIHHEAELERLSAGFDGCGCHLCQELYNTIDLTKYGNRVVRVAGFITVKAGRSGADKWDQYHQLEMWTPIGQVFITDGKGYCVSPTGSTVWIGPVNSDGKPLEPVTGTDLTPPLGGQHSVEPVTNAKPIEKCQPAVFGADVTARCRDLSGQGMSTRQIAAELEKEGIFISHMSVSRRLQGVLV